MVVNELLQGQSWKPIVQQKNDSQGVGSQRSEKFVDTIKEFVTDTNALQVVAADARDRFIKGEPIDLHDVMISAQKAKTSFELLMELRNKGLDLYRETLRMQV